jgi:hypothetical protein
VILEILFEQKSKTGICQHCNQMHGPRFIFQMRLIATVTGKLDPEVNAAGAIITSPGEGRG